MEEQNHRMAVCDTVYSSELAFDFANVLISLSLLLQTRCVILHWRTMFAWKVSNEDDGKGQFVNVL